MYKNASRLLINNMFFLMMIGFVMLTRLDLTLAIKQFLIAVVSVGFSLVVPVIIEKAGFLSHLGIAYGVLGLLVVGSVFVFGRSANGATNWVTIAGIGFQPSELAKIIFVFFVAAMLYKDVSLKRIIFTSVIAAVFVLILVVETDLGAAVIFFVTYILMLYVASKQLVWPVLGLSAGSLAAVVAYHLFSHVRRRVIAWQDPWSNYNDAGYQIAQSLFAIGTGGWFGMGLYQGMPKDIPVRESDFIFSVIAEELGGFFAICLLLVYISCFIMFINISLQLTNNFYKILAVGLSIAYGFQLFLCVGGVIKFIPHTGVTLPLISYGGSSILSTIIVFAVIQGLYLAKQKEVQRIEEQRREIE
jgi:cell division protein FtsW (lipid II flippase)